MADIRTENTTYIGKEFLAAGANVPNLRQNTLTNPIVAAVNGIMAARTEASKFLKKLYSFTVTSANATKGAVYKDANGNSWTVVATIAGSTTLVLTSASGTPPASGTLTKDSGTGDATITFSNPGTSKITQPLTPRVATITGTGSDHDAAGDVIITGKDIRGNSITDTITLNGSTTVAGIKAFASIDSIDFSSVTALDADAHVEVGIGTAFGLDRCMGSNGVFIATVDGVQDTLPTVTFDASVVSKNTVIPSTTPDGSKDFIFTFVTNEVYAPN